AADSPLAAWDLAITLIQRLKNSPPERHKGYAWSLYRVSPYLHGQIAHSLADDLVALLDNESSSEAQEDLLKTLREFLRNSPEGQTVSLGKKFISSYKQPAWHDSDPRLELISLCYLRDPAAAEDQFSLAFSDALGTSDSRTSHIGSNLMGALSFTLPAS